MQPSKQNILGFSKEELSEFAVAIGESAYRGSQLFQWLYEKGVTRFEEMSNLGKDFRQTLSETATIDGVTRATSTRSAADGTVKVLFALGDGQKIESVLIPPASTLREDESDDDDEPKRLTLCISTQVGCPLDCKFCATGVMGFARNLTSGEIVDQVLNVRRNETRKITNLVFMGMGEPLMNYDNVMNASEILSSGVGIPARRITISTAGLPNRIRQMGDERRKPKLAISLHSTIDDTRSKLMPINKRFGISELIEAVEYYYSKTKERVTYEYIFFDGVNDSGRDVASLIKFVRRTPSKLNIIPYHSIAFAHPTGFGATLRPSPKVERIVETLRKSKLTVMVRSSAGEDISAACGQLATQSDMDKKKHGPKHSPSSSHSNQTST